MLSIRLTATLALAVSCMCAASQYTTFTVQGEFSGVRAFNDSGVILARASTAPRTPMRASCAAPTAPSPAFACTKPVPA
jgi:hypothetical protein